MERKSIQEAGYAANIPVVEVEPTVAQQLSDLEIDHTRSVLATLCGGVAKRVVKYLAPINEALETEAHDAWAEATKPWHIEPGEANFKSQYGVAYTVYGMSAGGTWRAIQEGTSHELTYAGDADDITNTLRDLRTSLIATFARPTHQDGDKVIHAHDTIVLRRPYKIEADYDMVGGGFVLKATARYHLWNSADTKPGTVSR